MEAPRHVQDALLTIQLEYVEMPQLKLTARQVQRLWSLSTEVCEAALSALLRKGFLTQASDGGYVRSWARPDGPATCGVLTGAA